jgi:pyruvate dehydrogenase E1 component alpha subunit
MANADKILDFQAQLKAQEEAFPTLRILDETGQVVDSQGESEVKLSEEALVTLMERMVFSRTLNDRSTKLAKQGRLGFFAPTIGQEASQTATSYAFESGDYLLPGYRDIPQMILKGLPIEKAFLWSRGHQIGNEMDDLQTWMPQIIIGAQHVEAAGVALGLKKRGKANVVYTYTGDGASSQGDFYEGLNFAGAYQAPAVFFIQNNGYAISTPRKLQTAAPHLAAKGWAAGVPSIVIDGMDPLACYLASKQARDWAVAGKGPVLIEALVERFGPHSMSGDDPLRYRSKAEIDSAWTFDPLVRYRIYLENKGLWNEEMETAYIETVNAQIDVAVKAADNVPKQKISDFIASTLEVPGFAQAEQIEKFKKAGK